MNKLNVLHLLYSYFNIAKIGVECSAVHNLFSVSVEIFCI